MMVVRLCMLRLLKVVRCMAMVTSTLSSTPLFAQENQLAAESPDLWFDQIVTIENSALINGLEYTIPFKGFQTHPFYQSADGERTTITYDGDVYRNVTLLYDAYSDEVILKSITSGGAFF